MGRTATKQNGDASKEARRLIGMVRTGDRFGFVNALERIRWDDLDRIEKSASKIRKRTGSQAEAVDTFIEKLREERSQRKFDMLRDQNFVGDE